MGEQNSEKDGEEPCAQEPFPGLLGGNLDQRSPPKRDTTEVGPNIVCYDHGHGQEEPDHSFKDVVDDKMRLPDDEEEGHVSPSKLRELEFVMVLLERAYEEDEAYNRMLAPEMPGAAPHSYQ